MSEKWPPYLLLLLVEDKDVESFDEADGKMKPGLGLELLLSSSMLLYSCIFLVTVTGCCIYTQHCR